MVVKRRKLGMLTRALDLVLTEARFAGAAAAVAHEAAGLDGPARAAELVEALGRTGRAAPSVDVSEGRNL